MFDLIRQVYYCPHLVSELAVEQELHLSSLRLTQRPQLIHVSPPERVYTLLADKDIMRNQSS
jgi:hypothetical protein